MKVNYYDIKSSLNNIKLFLFRIVSKDITKLILLVTLKRFTICDSCIAKEETY